MAQWQQRDWPGNVRELRNFADQLVLGVAHVNEPLATTAATAANSNSLPQRVDASEAAAITAALKACEGNVAQAAQDLGIPKKTLYDKLKKYQITAQKSAASETH